MEQRVLVGVVATFIIAVVVYGLAVQLAFWRIPRRSHWVPGTLVSFFGAALGGIVLAPLGVAGAFSGAALGALGLVFAAVKVGTPGSVVLTVNTDGVSGEKADLDAEGFRAPFVWPYHFAVEKFGHVSFELVGKPGIEVTLSFPPDNTPFGRDPEGKPRCTFTGTVPGTINASPVTTPSTGKYMITKRDPKTGETVVNDPTWNIPRRRD